MRLTITRILQGSFGVLILLLLVSLLLINGFITQVEAQVARMTQLYTPAAAAAFEMEINVNGTGMAVFQYVDSGDPQYRARVEKDAADFANFHAQFDRLTETAAQQTAADEVVGLYSDYLAAGQTLMTAHDDRVNLLATLNNNLAAVERLLEDSILALTANGSASSQEKFQGLAALETDLSEISTAVRDHVSDASDAYRTFIETETEQFRNKSAAYRQLELTPAEIQQVDEWELLFEESTADIQTLLDVSETFNSSWSSFSNLRIQLDNVLDDIIQIDTQLALTGAQQDTRQTIAQIGSLFWAVVIVSLLAGTGVLTLLFRGILRPMQSLLAGIRKVARDELAYRLMEKGWNEFVELSSAFNQMVDRRQQAEAGLQAALAELREQRTHLQGLLDSLGEGVIYTEDNQPRYVNYALAQMTGYSLEEWGSYPTPFEKDRKPKEDSGIFQELILKSNTAIEIWRGEAQLKRANGLVIDVGLTRTVVVGADQQIAGVVTVVRDISQEKALQAQQRRFVSNASHELRTPVANLMTRLYLLRKQPEKGDQHLAVIEMVVDKMRHLVDDLLDMSRFERGVIPMQYQKMDVQALVAGVLDIQEAEAEAKGITLKRSAVAEPLYVSADPERLSQVFTNLVVNAINYTPAGGEIDINVNKERGKYEPALAWVNIEVRDTGIGIAPEYHQDIFKPFFRANQGDSRGTGLGLSIVKEIVEAHEGVIGVESEVGQGSCFSVKLALLAEN
jgi:PAS domain S-box-containing protein